MFQDDASTCFGSKSMLWQSAVQEPQGVAPNLASPARPTSPQMAAAWLLSRCVRAWTAVCLFHCVPFETQPAEPDPERRCVLVLLDLETVQWLKLDSLLGVLD